MSRVELVDVYGRLRRAIRLAGSQKAFADEIGVSPAFINQVLNAVRPPNDALLRRLGLRRRVVYEETNV